MQTTARLSFSSTDSSSRLSGYFSYVGEDGPPEIDTYVATGARLFDRVDFAALREMLPAVRLKIAEMRRTAPLLALQADLLAVFFKVACDTPGGVRTVEFRQCQAEAAFALAYIASCDDMIPDHLPDIGFADDAAVVEAALLRNAIVLAAVANELGMDWRDFQPGHGDREEAEARRTGAIARFLVP